MKVRFNGYMEKNGESGCGPCGSRRKTSSVLRTNKTFFLPSGVTKTFSLNHITEVPDSDVGFLLLYNNSEHTVFEVVENGC